MPDYSGKSLGKYQLQARLGRGGMAEVYQAYQPGLERFVAVKILHPYLADTPDFLTRFKREAQAIAQLHHPHIVQVYDFDVEGDAHYMVMEYIEGQTLSARLDEYFTRGERMALPEVLNLFHVLLDAVGYAHARHITHRDLKPANVILEAGGRAVLADFGIVKIFGSDKLTATGVSLGTPAYMSPEQGQGEPGDTRSDLYALGIMLYECLTGQTPYQGDTSISVMLKHISAPIPPLRQLRPDLSRELEQVVTRALAKNPAERYQTAAEMWQALAATLDDSEIRAVASDSSAVKADRTGPPGDAPAAPATEPPAAAPQAAPRRGQPRRNVIAASLLLIAGLALAGAFALPRILSSASTAKAVAQGQRLVAEGKYQMAVDAFSLALQNEPGHVAARLGRAQAYEGLAFIDKALADVEQVVELAPQNPAGYQERARLNLQYEYSFAMDAIMADLDRAVALAPQSARAHFLRGWALLNFPLIGGAPSPSAALADLQAAVELDAQNADAQLALAKALLALGRASEALAPANRAVEVSPQTVLPLAQRARLQFALNDYHSAIDDLTAASSLEADPTEAATLFAERGYLHFRLQASAEARADLDLAVGRDPTSLLVHCLQALLDPAAPRLSREALQKTGAAAPDDPIWQALVADLLAAP
jgi:tetratricopeptide (TPR) repeat protein/tRNA A-37 threonylcarbamoyl transferase component Bud32